MISTLPPTGVNIANGENEKFVDQDKGDVNGGNGGILEKYLGNSGNGGNGVNTLGKPPKVFFTINFSNDFHPDLPPPGVNITNGENEKLKYQDYGVVNGGNDANGGILKK